jgi:hypothetical protein
MILPHLRLPDTLGASAPVHTEGITTMHRSFLGGIGLAQAESYAVTDLSGTASVGILAL